MKHIVTPMIALALSVSLLSGCGSKSNEVPVSSPAAEAPSENASEEKAETPSETPAPSEEAKENATVYPFSITVRDQEGLEHEQVFNEAPKKAVTNNQASTELLLALGLEEFVIGTGDIDNDVLPELQEAYDKIPAIAEKGQVAKEVVIGADPDFVIGRAMSFTDERYGTIAALNEMGINTYVQEASLMNIKQTLDNIILDVRNVGKIFDIQDKANEFADSLQKRLDTIKEKTSAIEGDPAKVMFMVKYVGGEFSVFGQNASLQTKMLEDMNAVNVAEKGGTLSAENLIALNPDVIIYVTANNNAETDKTAIEDMLANETISSVSAIANKRIATVEYTELMGYGFRTFDAMEKIAKAVYPDIFE